MPSSLQQLAVKYNIPSRMWQTSFFLIFERLRHAWMTTYPAALDLLTDQVYDAYKFYTDLLEDQLFTSFRTAWIEALGDLARYRMTIASHVSENQRTRSAPVSEADGSGDGAPASSGDSVGAEVAQSWVVEDKETWRTTARDWYTMGITEKPGEGRLHHHLALLCRDIRGQEGRALHHFTKSLVVTHQYTTSRESLLPLFGTHLQSQRSLPEATAMDLFVRLHGMLFTKIDLDDFKPVLARFMERLEEDARLDGVSRKATVTQVDWIIMGSVNIAAMLEYGAQHGAIRKALNMRGQDRRRGHAATEGEGEEGDDDNPSGSGRLTDTTTEDDRPAPTRESRVQEDPESNPVFAHAWELTCAMLKFTFEHPTRQQGLHAVLNPYMPLLFTFLATITREPAALAVLSSSTPWLASLPFDFVNETNLDLSEETRLLPGPPLPEDWAMRGMEWVGRRVYERGFWKPKATTTRSSAPPPPAQISPRGGYKMQSEMDVLLASFEGALDISEGVVDDGDGGDMTDGPVAVNQRRYQRVGWAIGVMLKHVDGIELRDGKVVLEGELAEKVARMQKREEEEQRRKDLVERARKEKERLDEAELEAEDEDERDTRVCLCSLEDQCGRGADKQDKKPRPADGLRKRKPKLNHNIVPGYTMLVFDTNVLLSALPLFERSVEKGQWTVVVPLPVVTELDGLSKNPAPLGTAAVQAISYLESRIRTHSLCLKIQTSRGNYLSDLLIRTEHVDFSDPAMASRNMDDLILGVAGFQVEHFTDRSAMLGMPPPEPGATKVLLVTSDRNLRLRAQARGIPAADDEQLQEVLDGL